MASLYLTQEELNVPLRGLLDAEILMYMPDKNVIFPSNAVTSNVKTLSYTTNLQSVIEFSSLPQSNIATFENNSWILDGSFICPAEAYSGGGDSYTGFISNAMTDDNGNYTTNPIITVKLASTVTINYLSIKFAGGIDTSYPKVLKIRTYNAASTKIGEHSYTISQQTGLPLLVVEIGDEMVTSLQFEFVGTVCPHRRTRLNKIMFGKVEEVDPDYLQDWSLEDEVSLVADSIPTKTFTYSIIDYDRSYDVDNPGNKIPEDYNDVQILFTFMMEVDNVWKYAPTKTFSLMEISTDAENGLVTFTCGSILDALTETYDQDLYTGKRTIQTVMNNLLTFSGLSTDQCIFYNDYGSTIINVPLPESPVREIIQLLALTCGATLTVNDDNIIVFSKKDISKGSAKFMFHEPSPFSSAAVLIEEPEVEALENTTNLAMYLYNSTIATETSDLGTTDVDTNQPIKISYSAGSGSIQFDAESLEAQGATITANAIYSQNAIVQVSASSYPISVTAQGLAVTTTQTLSRKNTTTDTTIIDSQLAYEEPANLYTSNNTTFSYKQWYGAKYKYKCTTRNEYLVKAGDIIYLETPFSNGSANRRGYVLKNSYSHGSDTGEMEVILVD